MPDPYSVIETRIWISRLKAVSSVETGKSTELFIRGSITE